MRRSVLEVEGDSVAVTTYASWGGYVKTILKLRGQNLSLFTARNNWNGTGSECNGTVVVSAEEAEEIRRLLSSINDIEEFEKLVEKLESMIEEREKRIDRAVDRLYLVFQELCSVDEFVSRIEKLSRDELRDIIYNFFG